MTAPNEKIFNSYSFATNKNADGTFTAVIAGFTFGAPAQTLHSETFSTRAKATGWAKRWVLFYRRRRDAETLAA